jgi:hypothetical protein
MYTCIVHCRVHTYQLDRVLQGPGKFLQLISRGLNNKVYNLNMYSICNKVICNKVYTNKVYT